MKKSFVFTLIASLTFFLPTLSVEAAPNTTGCRAYFGTQCVEYYGQTSTINGIPTTYIPNCRAYFKNVCTQYYGESSPAYAPPQNTSSNCHAYYKNICIQYRSSARRDGSMTVCKQYIPYYSGCYTIKKRS